MLDYSIVSSSHVEPDQSLGNLSILICLLLTSFDVSSGYASEGTTGDGINNYAKRLLTFNSSDTIVHKVEDSLSRNRV